MSMNLFTSEINYQKWCLLQYFESGNIGSNDRGDVSLYQLQTIFWGQNISKIIFQ